MVVFVGAMSVPPEGIVYRSDSVEGFRVQCNGISTTVPALPRLASRRRYLTCDESRLGESKPNNQPALPFNLPILTLALRQSYNCWRASTASFEWIARHFRQSFRRIREQEVGSGGSEP